ncbi:MAG: TnpV protein [Gracilibacteraceae bacterium]|nr:TnpV protein [Gracilibacteraceae bacterium]
MEALTYRTEGDHLVPNLIMPVEEPIVLGKYALLREKYLKQHRRVLYLNLLTAGTLNGHLAEIEQTAMERLELLTSRMAQSEGVTEEMKAADQMKWVGLMNGIRHSAEETILSDLIYA